MVAKILLNLKGTKINIKISVDVLLIDIQIVMPKNGSQLQIILSVHGYLTINKSNLVYDRTISGG